MLPAAGRGAGEYTATLFDGDEKRVEADDAAVCCGRDFIVRQRTRGTYLLFEIQSRKGRSLGRLRSKSLCSRSKYILNSCWAKIMIKANKAGR